MALPLIGPGRSLGFALLPEGEDPDDLVRSGGREAIAQLLARALPLADLIWVRETENKIFATPERRAGLERRLSEIASEIRDEALRRYFQAAFKERLFQFFRRGGYRASAATPKKARGGGPKANFEPQTNFMSPPMVSTSLAASPLLRSGKLARPMSEGLILLLLLNHPGLIGQHIEELAEIAFSSAEAVALRDALVALSVSSAAAAPLDRRSPDAASLRAAVEGQGFGPMLHKLDAMAAHGSHWYVKAPAAEEDAEEVLKQALTRHRKRALEKELEFAKRAFEKDSSEANFIRLKKIQEQLFTLGGTEASLEGFGVLSGHPSGTL
jgi:DNA primase